LKDAPTICYRVGSKVTEETVKKSEGKSEPPPKLLPDLLAQLEEKLQRAIKQRAESERKAADYLNKLQRLQADMENIQKITKRQVEAVTSQASERLLMKLLPSLDALRQAVKIAGSNDSLPRDEVVVGLKMLQEQLAQALETEGLEEISAVGHPLNPELHEVVSYVETDEKPENMVLEEVRVGYKLNGRVIRPSLVVVSKKPKPPESHEARSD
jgi:molecular chaperone GrpE